MIQQGTHWGRIMQFLVAEAFNFAQQKNTSETNLSYSLRQVTRKRLVWKYDLKHSHHQHIISYYAQKNVKYKNVFQITITHRT
jgi:hypothetical protein